MAYVDDGHDLIGRVLKVKSADGARDYYAWIFARCDAAPYESPDQPSLMIWWSDHDEPISVPVIHLRGDELIPVDPRSAPRPPLNL